MERNAAPHTIGCVPVWQVLLVANAFVVIGLFVWFKNQFDFGAFYRGAFYRNVFLQVTLS